ncbi:MAG: hypothetical protein ABI662_03020 [Dermatophilaceae bacterium]
MFPYQLSRVLAEQHVHDMVVARERYEQLAAARRNPQSATERLSRIKVLTAWIRETMPVLHGPHSVQVPSSGTSSPQAGPMGCSA